MHERRYQTEAFGKKYKRLKTIIYRCQGPLGNHMLCAELMCFYLVWVCVFFSSFSLWIIHLYLSHLLYHALFFCWWFFFGRSCSFVSIPQCSWQWSPVTCENFSHSINTSIPWMVNLFARAHRILSLVDSAFRCLIFIQADI